MRLRRLAEIKQKSRPNCIFTLNFVPMNHTTSRFLRCDEGTLYLQGKWVLANYHALIHELSHFTQTESTYQSVDFSALDTIDTAGAEQLCNLLTAEKLNERLDSAISLVPEREALLRTVAQALKNEGEPVALEKHSTLGDFLASVGLSSKRFWNEFIELSSFVGLTLETLFFNMLRPSRWRVTSIVAQIEEIAINAVPIISLLTFLVGAVVAFLGATILSDFGATIYTVDLVGYSFLREFAVLLTAILMAGRTASAFTAQIGSMKANEEIDALRAQGLNPMLILVIPRILAMLVAMPILTFVGMIAGIFGGLLVCYWTLGISPTLFLDTLQADVAVRNLFVGMSKAPIFAFLIAVIGCQQGFKVTGSAQSVGERTTTAVVHSIFIVILIDALAALYFMEMGW